MTENSDISKFSACARVVSTFLAACETEKVSPKDAYSALGGLLGLEPKVSGTAPKPSNPPDVMLTPQQVKEAKREFLRLKAQRLKVSPSEVNLTPEEVKTAKANFRKSLSGRSQSIDREPKAPKDSNKKPKKSGKSKEKVPLSPSGSESDWMDSLSEEDISSGKKEVKERKKVGVQEDKTGSRATAKTKIDGCRRACLRALPTSIDGCTFLHLVAYLNHRVKLENQWNQYQEAYEPSGMLDPTRGLPSANDFPMSLMNDLKKSLSGLEEQSSSPGIFILQDLESGASFWDRDMPSKHCPDFLRKPLTEEQLGQFEYASKQAQARAGHK
jgi:hypothetical protein